MSLSAAAKWVLLALVGVAIAIGVAIAAANLTSQQIGIANESVSAGDALAPSLSVPAEGKPHHPSGDHGGPEEETPTTLPTAPEGPAFQEPRPTTEEPSSPQGEGTGEDHGHGPDGDD
ncbi:MAG TPA: hypothetical protein VF009_04710 [Solirubrobacterales bacterium]